MSIQSRSILILALLISQLACVVLGVVWFGNWIIVGGCLMASTCIACFSVGNYYESHMAGAVRKLNIQVDQSTRSLMKTRNAVIFGMAKLAESRDTDTGDHLDRIRFYSTILAKELQRTNTDIDDEFVDHIGLASALHDIGKVGVPDSVLLKPGRLDDEERKVIEEHPEIGGRCLSAIMEQLGEDDFLSLAREITYYHHEKWDGSGYPFKLSQDDIPLSARIVAVADVYDALRSKRPYKDEMSHEKTCQIINEGSGSHFDPKVVIAFNELEKEFLAYSEAGHLSKFAAEVESFMSFSTPEQEPVAMPSEAK